MHTFLRPVARIAGLRALRQSRRFLAAHQRTRDVQQRLLKEMIAAAAGSAFGRDHGFDRISSYRDFASAVAISDYEAHRPYLQRVLAGDVRAMFPPGTKPLMFATTSGTTGTPKHIPVTGRFLADYCRGWNIFGINLLRDHPDGWLRKILTISSSPRESFSPAGIACGSISGMLAARQKWIVRRMYPVPPAAGEITDPQAKYYSIIRSAITHDVAVVTTANPSSAVKLAETACRQAENIIRDVHDGTLRPPEGTLGPAGQALRFRPDRKGARRLQAIVDRNGELLPRHFWNLSCLAMWTGGTVGLYLPRVRQLYGQAPLRDIGLLASEGRMSIPLVDHSAAGVADITSNFLEFVPVEQIGSARPDVFCAHDVGVGGEYFIILTNWAGLWRYHIDDRVRVVDRLGGSPVIEFLSRGLHSSSITGEKLTEHQVVQAMAQAAQNAAPSIFTLTGHYASLPYYELLVEDGPGLDCQALGDGMDRALRRLNVEYDAKRTSGRLGPIRIAKCPPGTFAAEEYRRINLRRGRAEQYKHKYLQTEIVDDTAA